MHVISSSHIVIGDGLFSGNETVDIIDGDVEDISSSGDICGCSGDKVGLCTAGLICSNGTLGKIDGDVEDVGRCGCSGDTVGLFADGVLSGKDTVDIIDGGVVDMNSSGDICGCWGDTIGLVCGLDDLGDLGVLADSGVCSCISDLSVKNWITLKKRKFTLFRVTSWVSILIKSYLLCTLKSIPVFIPLKYHTLESELVSLMFMISGTKK